MSATIRAAHLHREITEDDAKPMTVVDAIVEVVTDVFHILRDEMRHGHILLHLADALEPPPAPAPRTQGSGAPQQEEKRTAVWRMVAQGLRNVASAVGEEETTVGKALRTAARVLAPMAVAAPFVAIAGLPILAVIVIAAILDRVWYGSASASAPAVRSSFFRPVIAMCAHPFLWAFRALYSSDSVVVRTLLWYRNELAQLLSLSRRVVVTHAGAGAGAGAGAAAGGLRDNWPNLVAALRRNFGVLQHAIEGGERRFGEALRLFRGFQRTAFLRHVSLDVAYDFYKATPFLGTWWLDTRHEWSALPAFAPMELQRWGDCTTMAELQAWAKRLLARVSQYLAKHLAPVSEVGGPVMGRDSRDGRAKQDLRLAALAYLMSYDIYAWDTVRFPAVRKKFENAVHDRILTPWMRRNGTQTLREAVRNDAANTFGENGRVAPWKAVFYLFGVVQASLA